MIPNRGHPHPPTHFVSSIPYHAILQTTISDIFLAFVKYASALDFSSLFFFFFFFFGSSSLLLSAYLLLSCLLVLMDGWKSTRTSL
ncbi:hypothetical protein LZ31DRAFT_335366 [Colletotrichum somersetense]|nr:hypothetical protein LZ31DRAFT_335366 [Colletotrichum somersetense]